MMRRFTIAAAMLLGIGGCGVWIIRAQDQQLPVAHGECTFFGPQREHFLPRDASRRFALSAVTEQVTHALGGANAMAVTPLAMPSAPGGSRTFNTSQGSTTSSTNLIDVFIWQAFKTNGVTPAAQTNDYEFIRRVTLDLTGRIPTAAAVQSFVADTSANKRATLIDQLLGTSQWLDRWTMFYGDLFRNAASFPSTGTQITATGRDAFNNFIRNGLLNGT